MPTYADLSGWAISIIAGRFEVIADSQSPARSGRWQSAIRQRHKEAKHLLVSFRAELIRFL